MDTVYRCILHVESAGATPTLFGKSVSKNGCVTRTLLAGGLMGPQGIMWGQTSREQVPRRISDLNMSSSIPDLVETSNLIVAKDYNTLQVAVHQLFQGVGTLQTGSHANGKNEQSLGETLTCRYKIS